MKEPVKGVTRCEKSLLCEVQILTSLFPVISHRIVQRMARKIWLLTVWWRFSWMARKVFAGVRRFVKLIVERFQVQGSSPCSTMVPIWFDTVCVARGRVQRYGVRCPRILGKRQRLAVLRLTVNQFPSGKHCRFNSYLPHLNMITSVQMDFSILPRRMVMSCSNSRYWIDWQLLLESDFKQEDRNYQQFCVVYHHREVKSRILVADE